MRHVMSHTAGLSGFEPADHGRPTSTTGTGRRALLAAQAPWWEPGTASGYHAITQGYLEGELVRRVTGRSIGTFFREEVAGPLGADFHIGLPASEDHRVADLVPPDPRRRSAPAPIRPDTPAARTCSAARSTPPSRAPARWRGAEIPAAGGTGNARSVARVHSALACGGEVDGVRLLSADGVERILEEQVDGTDLVLGVPMRFGMGFGLMSDLDPAQPQPAGVLLGRLGRLDRGRSTSTPRSRWPTS